MLSTKYLFSRVGAVDTLWGVSERAVHEIFVFSCWCSRHTLGGFRACCPRNLCFLVLVQ